jgi:hypothetical protein
MDSARGSDVDANESECLRDLKERARAASPLRGSVICDGDGVVLGIEEAKQGIRLAAEVRSYVCVESEELQGQGLRNSIDDRRLEVEQGFGVVDTLLWEDQKMDKVCREELLELAELLWAGQVAELDRSLEDEGRYSRKGVGVRVN